MVVNGVAANAERINTMASDQGLVKQCTHHEDLIDAFFGGNDPTGGVPSALGDANGSYGPGVSIRDRLDVWGIETGSISQSVSPKTKKNQQMKKIFTFLLATLTMGCGLTQIDAPAPNEHERWDRPGATVESTQNNLRECTPGEITSFEHLRIVDECMLGKGY